MLSNTTLYTLLGIDSLCDTLSVVAGTANRKYFPPLVMYFYYFCVYEFIYAMFTRVLSFYSINNLTYCYFLDLVSFIVLCGILIKGIFPAIKKNVLLTLMGFVILCTGYFHWQSDIYNSNPYVTVSAGLITCLLAFIFLVKLARKEDVKLLQTPEFWIVLAIFISSSFAALTQSAAAYIFLKKDTPLIRFYIVSETILVCIINLFYTIGFYVSKYRYRKTALLYNR